MTRTRRSVAARVVTAAGLLVVAGCTDDGGVDPGAAGTGTQPVVEPSAGTSTDTAPDPDEPPATGAGTGPDAAPTATDTQTAVSTQTGTVDPDEPTGDQGIDADTEPDTAEAAGEPPVLVDVRVGSHAGYDRVVWEFAGEGTPGWRAEYVDDPARQGSGAAVELPGDATLAVMVEGVGAPFEAPDDVEAYLSSERIAAASTTVVTEVVPGAWFEGYLDGFVGVTSEQPFRVRLFEDPTRVVLDVEH